MKSNKGITLVALVITIIVLLILAGVSISMVVGENGVLNRAKNATDETAKAQAKEALETSISGYQGDSAVIGKISNGGYSITSTFYDDLCAEIKKSSGSNFKMDDGYTVSLGTLETTPKKYVEATVSKTGSGGPWKFYIVESGAIGAVIQDKAPTT